MRKMFSNCSLRLCLPRPSGRVSCSFLVRATSAFASLVFFTPDVRAAGPHFVPDHMLKGSTTQGWHVLGKTQWRASDGELVGSPTEPEGGWLVLDRSLADAAFYADAHCIAPCEAGVLFRMEKTADGLKGVYFSFKEGDVCPYAVRLDGS